MTNLIVVGLYLAAVLQLVIVGHVLSHLLMARLLALDVKTLRVGFGPVLWQTMLRGTAFQLRYFPLGAKAAISGYGLSLRSRPETTAAPLPPGKRVTIAAAGPLGSFLVSLMAALLLWMIPVETRDDEPTRVGWVPEQYVDALGHDRDTPEYAAGLRAGDEIVAINGHPVSGWRQLTWQSITTTPEPIELNIVRDGESSTIRYVAAANPAADDLAMPFYVPQRACLVTNVISGTPAETAGIRAGDQLITINDQDVQHPHHATDIIRSYGFETLTLRLTRPDGETREITLTPRSIDGRPMIGVMLQSSAPKVRQVRISPIEQYRWYFAALKARMSGQPHPADVTASLLNGSRSEIVGSVPTEIQAYLAIYAFFSFSLQIAWLSCLPIQFGDGPQILAAILQRSTSAGTALRASCIVGWLTFAPLVLAAIIVSVFDLLRLLDS